MLKIFALALLCAAPALEQAKGHLKAGRIDEVYFALEGQKLSAEDQPEAARVLAEAGKKSLEHKDAVMALQLAKMAVKTKAGFAPGLEVASRACRSLEQFTDAEGFADQWLKAEPESAEARVWRAELAIDAGDWSDALAHLDVVKPKGPMAAKAKSLRDRAQKEQSSRQSGLSTLKQLERELAKAQAERSKDNNDQKWAAATPAASNQVVVYSTSWCGFCKKAKAWLQKKGVDFVEKDVEKDPEAQKELAGKAARAGVSVSGVPVIDVRGTLVQGFDQPRLEQLL